MTYEFALSSAWPSVVPVARRELRGFRLSAETVEDLIQETATVVLRKRPDFDSAEDLAPYVRIVVRRLALHWLRDNSRESVGPVPERPVLHAVSEVVEGRMRLAGTLHAFNSLKPGQQALLSDYISERAESRAAQRVGDGRASVRERKQVQRLRMAMARVADGFAAAVAWLRLRFPWLEALPTHAIAIGMALSVVVSALGPLAHSDSRPGTVAVASSERAFVPWIPVAPPQRSTSLPATISPSRPNGEESSAVRHTTTTPSGPEAVEVIRVQPPLGSPMGWEKRPDSPDKALVCAGLVVDTACVPKNVLPRTPVVPLIP